MREMVGRRMLGRWSDCDFRVLFPCYREWSRSRNNSGHHFGPVVWKKIALFVGVEIGV